MTAAGVPKISVLLSVYDGAQYLRESVDSVLSQDFLDFEFLIVDDGSPDASREILRGYADPRIVLLENGRNQGLFFNLNALLGRARAPLVKLWSQDDVMLPDCLRKGFEFHVSRPEIGCFYTGAAVIGQAGETAAAAPPDGSPLIFSPAEADRYALLHGCLSANISDLFFLREVFAAVGPFREDWIAADFEMMVRTQARYPVGRIPEALVRVRRHPGQWSLSENAALASFREEMEIYRILKERVVRIHRSMTETEADRVLERKFAANYFHAAVRCALRGRVRYAAKILHLLAGWKPLPVFAGLWLAGLPDRLRRLFLSARKTDKINP
ncbi:MAG TPA: glycosyltransferase [Candidatus Eisenbacteria bacterium]|nr:glycosyltransferase [Candidatus Eisenbacteria bacterium]